MPNNVKLNKTIVDGLRSNSGGPAFLWDAQISGFGVKALPSGKKRYVFKYRSKSSGRASAQHWLMLGSHGSITVDEARRLAQQAAAAVARGEDPQRLKQNLRSQACMSDLWARFERDYLPQRKPTVQTAYGRYWTNVLRPRFGTKSVKEVSRSDVDKWHKSMKDTPYDANRRLALLSRLMSLAEAWEMRDQGTNPCRYVQRFKEQPRSRYLSSHELKAIGQSLNKLVELKGELYRDMKPRATGEPEPIRREDANAIRLLLYTGARLNEILTAKLSWVDWDRRVIQLPDSKTGKKPIYLSEAALTVLCEQRALAERIESKFIFPGRSKGKHMINLRKPWMTVCKDAGISGVRLHDLRHTAASIAVGQGVSLPVIGRLLGHTQAQTTLRYAHVDNDPALAAANLIGNALNGLI